MARNRLLALALGVGVVAAVVLVAGRAFDLWRVFHSELSTQYTIHSPGYWSYRYSYNYTFVHYGPYDTITIYDKVDTALALAGAIFMALAFGAAARAFVQASQLRKRRLGAASALWFALYGAAILPVPFVSTRFNTDWFIIASYAAAAASAFALVVAATLIRIVVLSGLPSRRVGREIPVVELSPVPSHRVGWGAVGLALYFALEAARGAFNLVWLPDVRHLPGSLPDGVAMHAAGYALAAVAAATAAAALFGWWKARDVALRIAAIGVGLGFLVAGLGLILEARDYRGTGFLLEGISCLLLAVAAGGVAGALFSSEQRHSPDLPVLADMA